MITRIALHNFKAFENVHLDLAPITVLVGPNNSGKSSVISALRLLAQTMESPDRSVSLLLSGSFGDFGTFRDIVYRNHRGRPLTIEVSTQSVLPRSVEEETGVGVSSIRVGLTYKFRTKRRELILRTFKMGVNSRTLVETEYSLDSGRHALRALSGQPLPPALRAAASRYLSWDHFLPDLFQLRRAAPTETASGVDALQREHDVDLRLASAASFAFRREILGVEYLSAMRVPPARTYQFSGERRRKVGLHGENAPGILVLDAGRPARKDESSVIQRVSSWLAKAGMASSLEIAPISDRHYEIRVQHPMTGERENIADVGYGNSQVLPVLVGGYSRMAGDLFAVEEPEIHLHPRAQAELGDFLLDLYGVKVASLIETHSEHLVLRLQQHVAAGNIPSEHVVVYYATTAADNKKCLVRLDLDRKGRFERDWPGGFFPERLREATELARVRSKQLSLFPENK